MTDPGLLSLFLIIGTGYLLGKIPLGRVRLGGACVLFVGLAAGIFFPEVKIPQIFSRFGLIIFVYTIGLQAGPGFKQLLKLRGLRDSWLTLLAISGGTLATLIMAHCVGLTGAVRSGLFCGALTNTPALAAISETLKSAGVDEITLGLPVLAYSIAYPLGIVTVVISMALYCKFFVNEMPQKADPIEPIVQSFQVRNPAVIGKSLREVLSFRGDVPFVVTRIHRGTDKWVAKGESLLESEDIIVAVGAPEVMPVALQIFGSYAEKHQQIDREKFDFRRAFISNPQVIGKTIAELRLIEKYDAIITRLKREEQDIVPLGSTRLHAGDRVRVFSTTEHMKEVRRFLGDSIKSTAHADFGSMAFGMTLGVLLGSFEFPLPLGNSFKLGLAGGPLVMALLLGHLGNTGSIIWRMPLAANLTLRELGLLLFLAGVGLGAGSQFISALESFGTAICICAPIITAFSVWLTLLLGQKVYKIPPDYLLGMVAGIHTQSPSLAFLSSYTDSEQPRLAYSSVFPTATVLKIIFAQLLLQVTT